MRLVFRFLGVFIAMPFGVFAADPIVGDWQGTAYQEGFPPSRETLSFSSVNEGRWDSHGDPPCSGILTGGGADGVYHYQSTVTAGAATETEDGCVGGDVKAVLEGDTLVLEISANYLGQAVNLTVQYTRVSAPLRSCAECGEGLVNDIGYGLSQSSELGNYVYEAFQKYTVCVQDDPQLCAHLCTDHTLYQQLYTCNDYEGDGYRSCISTLYNGTIHSCN